MKLAHSIQSSLKEVDPDNQREPLAKKDDIIILKNQEKVLTIVECGFLSNVQEEKKLRDSEYRQKIAEAIANGLMAYFNQ